MRGGFILCCMLCLLHVAPAANGEEVVDGIAAQVGSEIVLISEVRQVSAPAETRLLESGGSSEELAILRAEVLERMIERALIRQVVRRAELTATDQEVDEAVAAIAAENQISLEQLQESVEDQGMPYAGYRERIRSEIEHSKVMNGMVSSRVRVEEEDVRALYDAEFGNQPVGGEEFHLRHLLVPFIREDASARAAACLKAGAALARIRGGEGFEGVARAVSAVGAERGGDIGWVHANSMAAWMRPAVSGLASGQTSEVIETDFGCNLLQLVESRPFEQVTYEDVRQRLREHLFNEQMAQQYAKFIDSLREQTFIERKGIFADASRLDASAPEPALGADTF